MAISSLINAMVELSLFYFEFHIIRMQGIHATKVIW